MLIRRTAPGKNSGENTQKKVNFRGASLLPQGEADKRICLRNGGTKGQSHVGGGNRTTGAGRPTRRTNSLKIKTSEKCNAIRRIEGKRGGIGKAPARETVPEKKSALERVNSANKALRKGGEGGRENRGRNKKRDCFSKANDRREVFGSSAAIVLVGASQNKRGRNKRRFAIKKTNALRPVEFMRAEGN